MRGAADVLQGDRRAAILHSVGANASHGLRRTNADKRRAVMTLLGDEEWRGNSDRWIAEKCGVGVDMVGTHRKQLSGNDSLAPRTGQDGKTRNLPARASAVRVEPSNDASRAHGLEDEEGPGEYVPEYFEPEDSLPVINPDRPARGWGSFELATQVTLVIRASKDFQARLNELFDAVDPRFRDEFAKRSESALLNVFEDLAARLPVDEKRAEAARARFHVLKGGK